MAVTCQRLHGSFTTSDVSFTHLLSLKLFLWYHIAVLRKFLRSLVIYGIRSTITGESYDTASCLENAWSWLRPRHRDGAVRPSYDYSRKIEELGMTYDDVAMLTEGLQRE